MEELFNQLEDELSKQGIFARRIDLDKCIEILHKLRQNYEKSIAEANKIIKSKNEILANADIVAKNTIKEAEKRSDYTARTGHYIYKTKEQADEFLSSTRDSCEELFDKTKNHIDTIFGEIEEYLDSMLDLIHKNREELKTLKLKVR